MFISIDVRDLWISYLLERVEPLQSELKIVENFPFMKHLGF